MGTPREFHGPDVHEPQVGVRRAIPQRRDSRSDLPDPDEEEPLDRSMADAAPRPWPVHALMRDRTPASSEPTPPCQTPRHPTRATTRYNSALSVRLPWPYKHGQEPVESPAKPVRCPDGCPPEPVGAPFALDYEFEAQAWCHLSAGEGPPPVPRRLPAGTMLSIEVGWICSIQDKKSQPKELSEMQIRSASPVSTGEADLLACDSDVVELGGIEPPSNAESPRLLRAQSVKTFCSAPTFVTDT